MAKKTAAKGKKPPPLERLPRFQETLAERTARAAKVFDALEHAMPQATIELDFTSPLELLVSVVLSAQTTDRRVNIVTPALFKAFPTARHYADSTWTEIAKYLTTLGLFRSKSKNLVKLGQALIRDHGGEVPTTRELLKALPGVGNKTAGVVTTYLGTEHAFPVDTHVFRLSRRLGFTRGTTPDEVEADMRKLAPPERWKMAHQLLIWHGRRVCAARAPDCHRCVVAQWCPALSYFVKKKKARPNLRSRPATARPLSARPSRARARP